MSLKGLCLVNQVGPPYVLAELIKECRKKYIAMVSFYLHLHDLHEFGNLVTLMTLFTFLAFMTFVTFIISVTIMTFMNLLIMGSGS